MSQRLHKVYRPALLAVLGGLVGLLVVGCGDLTPTSGPVAAAPTAAGAPTPTAPPPPQLTATPANTATPDVAVGLANTATAMPPGATAKPGPTRPLEPEVGVRPTAALQESATPTSVSISPTPTLGFTPLCYFSASYISPPLGEQIKESESVVQAQVTKIGPMVWNTADGKAPSGCDGRHYQYSPVEIAVQESYKGQPGPGSKLTLWLTGAPGSLIQGNYDYFPRSGERLVFFLGADDHSTPNDNPAVSFSGPVVRGRYHLQEGSTERWSSQINQATFTIPFLQAVIKNPAAEPTPTPYPPTSTPYARTGQVLQPVKVYSLNSAKSAYFKGETIKPEGAQAGSERFKVLLKAMDQPLQVLENLNGSPSFDSSHTVAFGFQFFDNTNVSFIYDLESNVLLHPLQDSQNYVRLSAPPELKKLLGG